MIALITFLFVFTSSSILVAQTTRKVLFLGNSYTAVNNLPQLVHDVALSAGDTLIFDNHAPGGYQLANHVTDATSLNKIMAGGWHYVVMQGQSQEPVVYSNQFNSGGNALHKLIKQYNPCAVPLTYMTWGRKNGDASTCPSFPVMCTYNGMDSALKKSYLNLTKYINGEVSPVSIVWKKLRQDHPALELYQSDESHPSMAGSYAAACCFYTCLFKKDPTLITFNPGLNQSDAVNIKNVVKLLVFDSLYTFDFKKPPVSKFAFQVGQGINEIIFSPNSQGVQQLYAWDFGDGSTSTAINPAHSYTNNGTYTVTLTTTNCDLQGLHGSVSDTVISFCSHTPTVYTTHTWLCNYDTLWTQQADSYQWYAFNVPLPETNRYLADYAKYNISGFSVMSTLNGCSELSRPSTKTPEWSGYYFDGIGDPCSGDTVKFAVLSSNGPLTGAEKIFWLKNDVLVPSMNNEDTLLIFSPGKYQVKVVNPASNCPSDTTTSMLKFDCGGVGLTENIKATFSIFPNPSSGSITLRYSNALQEEIEIYNAVGEQVKTFPRGTITLNVADLPPGLYWLSFRKNREASVKFIRQ